MKILALFILLLFVLNPHAKSQTADFAKLIRPFLKASQGYYEQRLTGAEFSERERQPQDFLFYPIHKGKDNQWFHLVWLMPSDKIRPLD